MCAITATILLNYVKKKKTTKKLNENITDVMHTLYYYDYFHVLCAYDVRRIESELFDVPCKHLFLLRHPRTRNRCAT